MKIEYNRKMKIEKYLKIFFSKIELPTEKII